MTVYLIAGTFDLLHEGHTNLFTRSFALAKKSFIVAVTSDAYTRQYKKIDLAETEDIRCEMVHNYCARNFPNHHITFVLTNGNWAQLYQTYGITHILHGDDWPKDAYINHMNRKAIENQQITVTLMPHTPGISSTLLRYKKSNAYEKTDSS
jgi:cytidyltransferase-like protein